jgi:hypothetical protein
MAAQTPSASRARTAARPSTRASRPTARPSTPRRWGGEPPPLPWPRRCPAAATFAHRRTSLPPSPRSKERKEANRAQKAARRPNFSLIQDVAGQWESLRRKDAPAAERAALASAILQRCSGRLAKLAGSHTAARVVQACLKHGGAPARAAVWAEVEPELLPLAKSPYGRFVVSKLVTTASKAELAGEFYVLFRVWLGAGMGIGVRCC